MTATRKCAPLAAGAVLPLPVAAAAQVRAEFDLPDIARPTLQEPVSDGRTAASRRPRPRTGQSFNTIPKIFASFSSKAQLPSATRRGSAICTSLSMRRPGTGWMRATSR